MVEYIQRAAGYCLSGDGGEQIMFLPYGGAGTGKGTFLKVLSEVLGTYSAYANPEMFMVKKWESGQPFDMAGMEGVRLLVAQETSEGKQLDVEKIKRMTGNDAKIHACRKFHDQYDFKPVWKIWLATNSRPDAPASDEATWDRLKVIPFDVRFRGQSNEIQNLAEKLVAEEGSGILNWMLEGHACRRMKNLRNHQPEKVSIAVNDWRDTTDYFARFLEDNVVAGAYVEPSNLYKRFAWWAEMNKVGRSTSMPKFKEEMKRRGFVHKDSYRVNGKVIRAWVGIQLKGMEAEATMPDQEVL